MPRFQEYVYSDEQLRQIRAEYEASTETNYERWRTAERRKGRRMPIAMTFVRLSQGREVHDPDLASQNGKYETSMYDSGKTPERDTMTLLDETGIHSSTSPRVDLETGQTYDQPVLTQPETNRQRTYVRANAAQCAYALRAFFRQDVYGTYDEWRAAQPLAYQPSRAQIRNKLGMSWADLREVFGHSPTEPHSEKTFRPEDSVLFDRGHSAGVGVYAMLQDKKAGKPLGFLEDLTGGERPMRSKSSAEVAHDAIEEPKVAVDPLEDAMEAVRTLAQPGDKGTIHYIARSTVDPTLPEGSPRSWDNVSPLDGDSDWQRDAEIRLSYQQAQLQAMKDKILRKKPETAAEQPQVELQETGDGNLVFVGLGDPAGNVIYTPSGKAQTQDSGVALGSVNAPTPPRWVIEEQVKLANSAAELTDRRRAAESELQSIATEQARLDARSEYLSELSSTYNLTSN